MASISVTKMSSKGQVVIPQEMRVDFKEGENIIVIKNDKQLILKKAKDFSKNIEEDLEFAKRTENALKRYEKGGFKELSFDNFLEEIRKW